MIRKLEWVLQTNLQFLAMFLTGKETFIHPSNVQDQIKARKECLKYVHVRAVVAFREIGRGLEAIKSFS